MERVCHLTNLNKVYREKLCIKGHSWMTAQIVTMDRLYPHYLSSQASWTWHSLQYGIVLSWDLLSRMISLENGIPCSFITTPELSGPLHISSDIYHTQITGYSQQLIYQINSDWSFREHLSRALPIKMIFRLLLRSILSEHLVGEYSAELILEIIITRWLQVSVGECSRQIPQTKIQLLLRDLVPSDWSTYMIASGVNFFDTKLSINQIPPQFSLTLKFKIYTYHQLSYLFDSVATNVINTPALKNIFQVI